MNNQLTDKTQSLDSVNKAEQALIMDYLYGQLSMEQRVEFEQRLIADPAFATQFNQQGSLEKLLPQASKPMISTQRMDAVRWSLQRQLRKQASQQNSLTLLLSNLWDARVSMRMQLASIAVSFFIGFLMANQNRFYQLDQSDGGAIAVDSFNHDASAIPMQLIEANDFQISDLQLKKSDPNSDRVQLVYSLQSRSQLAGNLADETIQKLLAVSMKNDVADGTRLDLVELLKDYASSKQVREALSYSLLNDPNPGVRMVAAESLTKLSGDSEIRDVLRAALRQDVNPGVRVEAFRGLVEYPDDSKTIELLQNYSVKDGNQYIRESAKALLTRQQQSDLNQI